jgi:hypothetical protein
MPVDPREELTVDTRVPEGLRAELARVEEELAQLRPQAAAMRERIGQRWDAPTDAAETAAALTAVEEQEALVERLEGRREALTERLGGAAK